MPALGAGTHVFGFGNVNDVDGRTNPRIKSGDGHDGDVNRR
jgi:hypothetical protein